MALVQSQDRLRLDSNSADRDFHEASRWRGRHPLAIRTCHPSGHSVKADRVCHRLLCRHRCFDCCQILDHDFD